MVGFELHDAMTLGDGFDRVVAAARGGEEWALRAVYEEFAPQVRGYLLAQGAADVDELLGEVFLQVVRDFAGFRGDESALRAWVLTIAHRRLAERQRGRSRRLSVSFVREPKGADRTRESEAKPALSREERVNTMLADLSQNQRSVVLLRALGDLSVEQVGDVLGKSPRTVARLQRRGLAVLARDDVPDDTEDESGLSSEGTGGSAYRVTDDRVRELTRLLGSLVEHAKRLRHDSDSLIHAVEEAIASLEAEADSRSAEPEGPYRVTRSPEPPREAGAAQPSSQRRETSETGAGREPALLRATQMAIRGRARTEIEAMLSDELGIANPAEIVDQILGPGRS